MAQEGGAYLEASGRDFISGIHELHTHPEVMKGKPPVSTSPGVLDVQGRTGYSRMGFVSLRIISKIKR